ncbi:hypothetical protein MKEN_00574100 [Mycena kentingensis (nom. inval.)]|nr:hypothetical protein MKEN_00574100 [Mycena kentingensis (nom. inval.)]
MAASNPGNDIEMGPATNEQQGIDDHREPSAPVVTSSNLSEIAHDETLDLDLRLFVLIKYTQGLAPEPFTLDKRSDAVKALEAENTPPAHEVVVAAASTAAIADPAAEDPEVEIVENPTRTSARRGQIVHEVPEEEILEATAVPASNVAVALQGTPAPANDQLRRILDDANKQPLHDWLVANRANSMQGIYAMTLGVDPDKRRYGAMYQDGRMYVHIKAIEQSLDIHHPLPKNTPDNPKHHILSIPELAQFTADDVVYATWSAYSERRVSTFSTLRTLMQKLERAHARLQQYHEHTEMPRLPEGGAGATRMHAQLALLFGPEQIPQDAPPTGHAGLLISENRSNYEKAVDALNKALDQL